MDVAGFVFVFLVGMVLGFIVGVYAVTGGDE